MASRTIRRAHTALMIVGLFAGGALAYGPTSVTKDEARCQQALSKSLGKQVAAHAKCLTKCDAGFAAGKVASFAECTPPYSGGTAACVDKVLAKSTDGIIGKCAEDVTGRASCPLCYGGATNCQLPGGFSGWREYTGRDPVATARAYVEVLRPLFFCGDVTNDTATQSVCRQVAMGESGKLLAAFNKCTAKCRDAQWKEKIPPSNVAEVCRGSSFPFSLPTDLITATCFQKAIFKFQSKYAGKCGAANENAPSCLATQSIALDFIATLNGNGGGQTLDDRTFCAPPQCTTIGGFCWFLGGYGTSCDLTCANRGRVYDPATQTYAGSDGALANCQAVMTSLQGGAVFPEDSPDCTQGLGCWQDNIGNTRNVRCTSPATTSSAADEGYRACACQ